MSVVFSSHLAHRTTSICTLLYIVCYEEGIYTQATSTDNLIHNKTFLLIRGTNLLNQAMSGNYWAQSVPIAALYTDIRF